MTRPEDVPEWAWLEAGMTFDLLYDACPDLDGGCEESFMRMVSRALIAAEQRGAERENRLAIGDIDTLIESVREGLMTDSDLTAEDRVAMQHQIEALDVAANAIRGRKA